MRQKYQIFFIFVIFCFSQKIFVRAQPPAAVDSERISKIYQRCLADGKGYDWLRVLCKEIGHRLSGTPEAQKAVVYTKSLMDSAGFDRVELQPCMVPSWKRGMVQEVAIVTGSGKKIKLNALSIGNSLGSDKKNIIGQVVEVNNFEELEQKGEKEIMNKIVLFNRPFDDALYNTFQAYSQAVNQRGNGASKAAKYGALAVLVRSMSTLHDQYPHTGALHYDEAIKKIPAFSISNRDADLLHKLLTKEKVNVEVQNDCKMDKDVLSYNVIGELRGTEHPEEIILVGGHLDSWDVGEGAHDDGAGCVQSLEVLKILKDIGYKPKRTIRCVMFMNEENGLKGGQAYADSSNARKEFHLASIESDRGGYTPRGFSVENNDTSGESYLAQLKKFEYMFDAYDLVIKPGGSGADISPLKSQKGAMIGFLPDPQRYFDLHHSEKDVFEEVNKRELLLGTAAMTALVYLIDQYGLKK